MKLSLSRQLFNKFLFSFFVFGTLFITFRILLIGTKSSQNLFEFFLSILPEIFVFFLSICFLFNTERVVKRSVFIDKMILSYVLLSIVLGLFSSTEFKFFLYGFRMTYIPMVFYFFGSFYSLDFKDLKKLIHNIFSWFSIIAVFGVVIYFVFSGFMSDMLYKVSDVLPEYFIIRMTSLFWSPVVFGTFMTVSFLYFVYLYLKTNNHKYLLFIFLFFFCLMMSLSRGAILVSFIGFLLLLFISKNWKSLIILTPLLFLNYVSVSFIVKDPITFSKWIINSTAETISMKEGNTRADLNKSAASDIINDPFGRGIGKAGHVAKRFSEEESLKEDTVVKNFSASTPSTSSTDGWFLKLANETGLLGLLFYLFFTTLIVVKFVKESLRKSFGIEHFLFTLLIIINIQNLVSNVLDFYLFSNLYWFLIGSLVFIFKNSKNNGFT